MDNEVARSQVLVRAHLIRSPVRIWVFGFRVSRSGFQVSSVGF